MNIKVNDCRLQSMLDLLDQPICAKTRREKRELSWQRVLMIGTKMKKSRNLKVPADQNN